MLVKGGRAWILRGEGTEVENGRSEMQNGKELGPGQGSEGLEFARVSQGFLEVIGQQGFEASRPKQSWLALGKGRHTLKSQPQSSVHH